MIELIYSNRTERLLDELVEGILADRDRGSHALSPVEIVVPNRNMETWVSLRLAEICGVAANLRFRRIERFVGELISEAFAGSLRLVDLDTVEAGSLSVLLDEEALDRPELRPVRAYLKSAVESASGGGAIKDLGADGADLRRVQLASRLAHLFQEYSFARPEMIECWRNLQDSGKDGRKKKGSGAFGDLPFSNPALSDPTLESTVEWQSALWRAVFGEGGVLERCPPKEGGRWTTLDGLARDEGLVTRLGEIGLPTVHVFGVSYVARLFQQLFCKIGEITTLRIYSLNPCAEYWEDVETHREFFKRLGRMEKAQRKDWDERGKRVWAATGETDDLDPFGLTRPDDMPALQYWGRPGREHIRLLGELTEYDHKSAFGDPTRGGKGGLLQRLQLDILSRNAEPFSEGNVIAKKDRAEADETLRLIAAPSVRREVEWVADEIWRLVREDLGSPPLRFTDIAVIVNRSQKEVYLPQIDAVFSACHNLPSSVSDLPGAAGSRFIEATMLMLKLPLGRFSRAEMLSFMSHQVVIGRFDDLSPGDLAAKAEALGIVFGADHSDHEGTYIDEDVFNWDQGIRRLALGAFMTGEKSGDERIFESVGGKWLVEESFGAASTVAARFGLLARALIADARFVREKKLRLTDWMRFFTAQIDAYLFAGSPSDSRDRLRCLRAISKLEAMDQGLPVSGRLAVELAARALETLGGGRGQYLADGVVVSSFLPMRAIPFKVVFVLGLGEGLFPASRRRDALDLRAARRRAGDVGPSERDRYMFLETLLCARERIYLSYVRRDEQTGDSLQPSAVVQELLHMLESGYLGRDGAEGLRTLPPLRRYDEPNVEATSFLDEARIEARVQEVSSDLFSRAEAGSSEGGGGSIAALTGAEIGSLRRAIPEDGWEKLASMLVLPGDPPTVSSVTTTVRAEGAEEAAVEAPVTLSLTALRGFLACPMQGWAKAMLGLGEDEDDGADREEEDFEIQRPLETGLLREVFSVAAARGVDPKVVYDEKASRRRLEGRLPVGVLGRALGVRHHSLLEGWHKCLARLVGVEAEEGEPPEAVEHVRFGRSTRDSLKDKIMDPLVLEVPLQKNGERRRVVPVKLSGRTEGLVDDGAISVLLQPSKPPAEWNDKALRRLFRYLTRLIIDHAVLAAAGVASSDERRLMVVMATDTENENAFGLRVAPLSQDRARAWLIDLLSDLLGEPHSYLLPCEAIFEEYYDRRIIKSAGRREATRLLPEKGNLAADGEALVFNVEELVKNERGSFSSLFGPVPSPRRYEPPSAIEAARLVERRFGPLFESILEVEVYR